MLVGVVDGVKVRAGVVDFDDDFGGELVIPVLDAVA